MTVGRAERRKQREEPVRSVFGDEAPAALDLLELTELSWHDVYGEISPPDDVVDGILLVSGGTLDGLIRAAHLAVTDRRDLHIAASKLR